MVEDVMAGVCDEILFCGIFWSESGMMLVGVGGCQVHVRMYWTCGGSERVCM